MSMSLSPNTQAILLLTAPLMAGRSEPSAELLTSVEYKRLAQFLRERQQQPADLLAPGARELIGNPQQPIDSGRIERLLARGFLLSQAVERWQTRAIWVVSRADAEYPRRWKMRLKEEAPPVLYGCGDAAILDTGGLAVVGSRNVDDALIAYTEEVGRMAARARRTLVSGGARGIDQAAMRGALDAGGKAAGVLADSLEKAALNREHRRFLMEGQLVLVSTYDPMAGFNVGHAMQRNKLIYALADAALVVNSDYEKGGTWAGAVEQLDRLRFVPVYVRSNGQTGKGLEALQNKGALPWGNPETPEALAEALAVEVRPKKAALEQKSLFSSTQEEPTPTPTHAMPERPTLAPAEELFTKVRELLGRIDTPKTDAEVAADLHVSKNQAKEWLHRLVEEGLMEKHTNPVRYSPKSQGTLLRMLPILLALPLGLLAIPSAEASCARMGGPHLLQAQVIACEDPTPLAKERIKKYDRFYHGTEPQREAGVGYAAGNMLSRQPARIVTLRVTRTQQLSDDPRHAEKVTREPWTEVEKPEEKRYLVLGPKDCEDLPAGKQEIFLEEFTCCDVIPPSDLACLLDLPALVEAPEER